MADIAKGLFDEPEYWTVSQLTTQIKSLVENYFASVWVVGEISSLTRAGSGHIYLSLKDPQALIRCVLWRTTALRTRLQLDEGMQVLVRGRLSVYPPRGDYQLMIDEIQPRGAGAQDVALKKLREKLAKLGYFAPERKRPIPSFPRRLALVTSPTGAAIRDMLEILGRRWPAAEVLVCPVRVQGEGAAEQIAGALRRLNRVRDIDAILLGRGGGSNEDLAAFNAEPVAHAIFASKSPVISAVGHEIDVTIADLVADRRALTPSEAAELATPDRVELDKLLRTRTQRLLNLLTGRFAAARQRLDDLAQRRVFRQPLDRLREQERRLDEWEGRVRRAIVNYLHKARQKADKEAARLESLSPLNVLARGYSLTRTWPDLHVVASVQAVRPGDQLEILLHDGKLRAGIESIEPQQ
jgi:exodeoxyribonuclease VII large subunit